MSDDPLAASTAILRTYCNLMEELKARHAVVHKALLDAREGNFAFSPYIVGELCFLQLRMMCELIALGCLLVHGDISATRTRRMQKAFAADWIIQRLEELHPSFYPLPAIETLDEAGTVILIEPNPRPHLTKADLVKLYAECGAVLHRGTLKSVLAADTKPMDLVRVGRWAAKITQLLEWHQIPLIGDRHQIWVVMKRKGDGNVHVLAMERVAEE
jgi:hypothetical protein